jgi:hypothetical protein
VMQIPTLPLASSDPTTGIVYCLAGQVNVMAYEKLAWDAEKFGLFKVRVV